MPLSLPDLCATDQAHTAFAALKKALKQDVGDLLHAAHQERKAVLDRGRVETVFRMGD